MVSSSPRKVFPNDYSRIATYEPVVMSYQKAAGWSPRSCITYHPNVFEHNILVVMFHPAVGSKYEMRRMNVLIYYLLDHLLLFETLILSEYIGRAYWNESYLSTDLNCYLIWAYLVQLICRNEWLVVFMCRRLGVPLAGSSIISIYSMICISQPMYLC